MLRLTVLPLLQRPAVLLFLLVSGALWVFVWVHAFGLDMTHDEAYSYRLIRTNYFRALFGSANTHWLNSFCMEIEQMVFGDAPGWLRLHSVLAFPFFALAIYRLGQLIRQVPFQLFFYALVLFNPYVIDFFSLARGYGLALTFQAWSLYYFIRAATAEYAYRRWLLVWLMNGLAIASNLSYFYTVAGMAGGYVLFLLTQKINGHALGKGAWRLLWLYVLLLLGTIADLLFIRLYGKDLGFGGNTNLVGSIFGSLWKGALYGAAYTPWGPVLASISFYVIAVLCLLYGRLWARKKAIPVGLLVSLPLLSILVLNALFHVLFNTPYLYQRTALQWYVPGIMLMGLAGGDWLRLPRSLRPVGTGVALLVCVVAGLHFYTRAHRQWCFEWPLQANSRQALQDLYAQSPRQPAVGFAFGGIYQNYYILLTGTLTPRPEDLPDQYTLRTDTALRQRLLTSDYVLTSYPVTLECLQDLGLRYEVLKTYPPGPTQLIRIDH